MTAHLSLGLSAPKNTSHASSSKAQFIYYSEHKIIPYVTYHERCFSLLGTCQLFALCNAHSTVNLLGADKMDTVLCVGENWNGKLFRRAAEHK